MPNQPGFWRCFFFLFLLSHCFFSFFFLFSSQAFKILQVFLSYIFFLFIYLFLILFIVRIFLLPFLFFYYLTLLFNFIIIQFLNLFLVFFIPLFTLYMSIFSIACITLDACPYSFAYWFSIQELSFILQTVFQNPSAFQNLSSIPQSFNHLVCFTKCISSLTLSLILMPLAFIQISICIAKLA